MAAEVTVEVIAKAIAVTAVTAAREMSLLRKADANTKSHHGLALPASTNIAGLLGQSQTTRNVTDVSLHLPRILQLHPLRTEDTSIITRGPTLIRKRRSEKNLVAPSRRMRRERCKPDSPRPACSPLCNFQTRTPPWMTLTCQIMKSPRRYSPLLVSPLHLISK